MLKQSDVCSTEEANSPEHQKQYQKRFKQFQIETNPVAVNITPSKKSLK